MKQELEDELEMSARTVAEQLKGQAPVYSTCLYLFSSLPNSSLHMSLYHDYEHVQTCLRMSKHMSIYMCMHISIHVSIHMPRHVSIHRRRHTNKPSIIASGSLLSSCDRRPMPMSRNSSRHSLSLFYVHR